MNDLRYARVQIICYMSIVSKRGTRKNHAALLENKARRNRIRKHGAQNRVGWN